VGIYVIKRPDGSTVTYDARSFEEAEKWAARDWQSSGRGDWAEPVSEPGVHEGSELTSKASTTPPESRPGVAYVEPRARSIGGPASAPQTLTKACADCAETVKAAARVCRFCGYRFESVPPISLGGDRLVSSLRHLFLEDLAARPGDSMTFPEWMCWQALKADVAIAAGAFDSQVVEAFKGMASAEPGTAGPEQARKTYLAELDRVVQENRLEAAVQRALTTVFTNDPSLEER
jgi:uncharacterized protein UPF0547